MMLTVIQEEIFDWIQENASESTFISCFLYLLTQTHPETGFIKVDVRNMARDLNLTDLDVEEALHQFEADHILKPGKREEDLHVFLFNQRFFHSKKNKNSHKKNFFQQEFQKQKDPFDHALKEIGKKEIKKKD